MFDSHCHLSDPRLLPQLADVLARAKAAGVTRMVTIGTDPPDHVRVLEICKTNPMVRCAIGIHPNECGSVELSDLVEMRELLDDASVVAVGEIGLDYHYADTDRHRQRRFLEAQLDIAQSMNKPVVIHCREAIDDGLDVLKAFPSVSAVFHCFTGTLAEGRRVLDAGYWIGFTGVVTFGRSIELRQLAAEVPIDRLLIETDAPYLAPEPMRKQRVNEPALVIHTAAAIATARQSSLPEIERATTSNATRFYRWGD